jgi:hypothetical protein
MEDKKVLKKFKFPETKNPETPPQKEESLEDLKALGINTETDIKADYNRGETLVKSLEEKISSMEKIKPPVDLEKLEKNITATKDEALSKIEQEIKGAEKETTFDHLKNYDFNSPEARLVNLESASEKIQNRFNEKINPEMQSAISLVAERVFNKCRLPYALIGSNCYVPHTEYSGKIPDDLDVVFGINDLGFDPKDIDDQNHRVKNYGPGVYSDLLELENQGLVKGLKVEELTKYGGEKNGCVKVKCLIKTAGRFIEMEAFAQHMQSEIAAGEKFNGIINLGAEKQTIEVIDLNGTKVNIGSEATAEELYLKNIVNEFALYDLNGWENRSYLNAKALQRIFNVTNLDHENFESSIDKIIATIGEIDPPTPEAKTAQTVLQNLWQEFKSTEHLQGPGLVNYLLQKNQIDIKSQNETENKILSTEKAVDLITTETQTDMKYIGDKYSASKTAAEAILDSPVKSPEMIKAAIDKIKTDVQELFGLGRKYKDYSQQVDSASRRDFCVYAAIPRLRNYFIKPVIVKLEALAEKLEATL